MLKFIVRLSPVLVALSTAAAVAGQAPEPTKQVTVTGCLVRNGSIDVDKGVRQLNMDPNGLALTSARINGTGTKPPSAVPGSIPNGSDSGTIPRGTTVGGQSDQADTVAFALAGNNVEALASYVGRRIEIVGRLAVLPETGEPQPRGTTGQGSGSTTGTREERPAEGSAHPSAELPKLDVVSFRGTTGGCQ